jgi:LPS sulfotransferase NodH
MSVSLFSRRLTKWLAVIFVVVTVFTLILLPQVSYQLSGHDQSALMVFKLPRSGSSWLTENLNAVPELYISKEIIQRAELPHFNGQEKTDFVRKALLYPSGKLATSRGWLPTSRFLEDYVFHSTWKIFRRLDHIGFSLNPEFCKGINWKTVTHGIKDVKVIIFERSNLAKSAVSAYRGLQTKQLCGTANLRSDSTCTIPSELNINSTEYINSMQYWHERYAQFHHYLREDPVLPSLPTLRVFYEDMQADPEGVMQQIRDFLAAKKPFNGVGKGAEWSTSGTQASPAAAAAAAAKAAEAVAAAAALTAANGRSWVKRSSDDLSGVLVDFKHINDTLSRGGPICRCWQKQLTAATCHREDFYKSCTNERREVMEVRKNNSSNSGSSRGAKGSKPELHRYVAACFAELEKNRKLL